MTTKLKKVLIALDYDPTAQKVAETGFALAKKMGAEVTLLHVIINPLYYSSPEYSPIMGYSGSMDMSQLMLNPVDGLIEVTQHFLDKSKQHLGDETIQTVIKEGRSSDQILKTANELHIDVIVMGSHSKQWLENIIMGSVTEEVLRHTTIPLFIVPTKKRK